MKKGIIVIHVPVGNIEETKVDKYVKKMLHPIKKAIKQIKKSGYIVLIFPSRNKTELQIEAVKFE